MLINTIFWIELWFFLFLYYFQGIGGFLPGVKQIANVAALPGIVGVRQHCTCRASILSLVQILCSFFLGMVTYNTNMIISLKQKKIEFEPRITLNHNIYISYFFNNWPYVQFSIYFKNNIQ